MVKKFLRFIILVAILGGVATWGFFAVKNREINLNDWFVPGQTKGVDVSSYQENVDFAKLKSQGIEFVYIKATEGHDHVDSSFSEKWAAAKAADLPAGAYHYFSYGISGAEQAQNFINTVGSCEGRLIPAVDMELTTAEVYAPPEKSAVVAGLKSFLAALEEKYHVSPLIYSQQDYYDKYLADDFGDYPRWVRNVFYPAYLGAGDGWLVWQYNDRGELQGYSGEKYIDLNIVNAKFGLDGLKIKN